LLRIKSYTMIAVIDAENQSSIVSWEIWF
jgi:hypothetical protein